MPCRCEARRICKVGKLGLRKRSQAILLPGLGSTKYGTPWDELRGLDSSDKRRYNILLPTKFVEDRCRRGCLVAAAVAPRWRTIQPHVDKHTSESWKIVYSSGDSEEKKERRRKIEDDDLLDYDVYGINDNVTIRDIRRQKIGSNHTERKMTLRWSVSLKRNLLA